MLVNKAYFSISLCFFLSVLDLKIPMSLFFSPKDTKIKFHTQQNTFVLGYKLMEEIDVHVLGNCPLG